MFSELCGFKTNELSALPKESKYALERKNLLIVGSLFFCGFSTFYLFLLTTVSFTTAILVTFFTIVLLFSLQNLIITASGIGCDNSYSDNTTSWQPAKIRIYIFFIVAFVCSQPLLLAMYSQLYANEINQSIEEQKKLGQEFLKNSLKEKEDSLTAQLNSQHEILERLTGTINQNINVLAPIEINSNITTNETNVSRRKALLIGNQAYPASPLVNPNKDAQDMSNELKEIGFNTVLITDGNKSTMEIEINKYIESIQPGDISYFYYSGHGMQQHGQNFIIPIDYPNKNAIGLNLILEGISKKKPTGNVITIDACRSFAQGDNGGLASLEAGSSTYISLAAKPGQTASDGKPYTNGVYTGAILKHIKEPIDIDSIFRKVIDEVTKATNNKQEPWINHNLHSTLILSSPEYKPNILANRTIQNRLDQINLTHHSRGLPLGRGIIVQDEVSLMEQSTNVVLPIKIEPSPFDITQLPTCEQKAGKLPPNDIKNFLINCNQKQLFKLEDEIVDYKENSLKAIEKLNDNMLYTNTIAYTLVSDLYYVKKHPIFLIMGTLIITSLLLLGFLMREIEFKEMSEYEHLLNYYLRNFVAANHRDTKNVTSLFPYAPGKKLRNAESSPYQYRDFEQVKIKDSTDISDFIKHLKTKNVGESI